MEDSLANLFNWLINTETPPGIYPVLNFSLPSLSVMTIVGKYFISYNFAIFWLYFKSLGSKPLSGLSIKTQTTLFLDHDFHSSVKKTSSLRRLHGGHQSEPLNSIKIYLLFLIAFFFCFL